VGTSQKWKKYSLLVLLGSAHVKASHKILVKLTPKAISPKFYKQLLRKYFLASKITMPNFK